MSDSNNWTSEWLKAQKKFVESWSDMAQGASQPATPKSSDFWSDSFDLWRKQYPSPSEDTNHVIDKCMSVGRGYFAMAEQIGKQIASGGKTQDVVNHWLEQLKKALQQESTGWSPLHNKAGHDFLAQWAAPSDSWQKIAAAMIPVQFPDSNPSVYGIGEDFQKLSEKLSIPGLGFFRESQEKNQQVVKLALQYFQANHKFNLALAQISVESLQAFQQKLTELYEDSDQQTPTTLRALYDLWVEISDERYADYVMSTEYQSLYADMVNKLMAFRRQYNDIIDDYLQSLNLPSRRELDTLGQRVQQLRRENHLLRREIKEIRVLLNEPRTKTSKLKSTPKKKADQKAGRNKSAATANKGKR